MAKLKLEPLYGSLEPERSTAGFDRADLSIPTLDPEQLAKQQAEMERLTRRESDLIVGTFTSGVGSELLELWSDYALLRPSVGENAMLIEGKKNHIRSIIRAIRSFERGEK